MEQGTQILRSTTQLVQATRHSDQVLEQVLQNTSTLPQQILREHQLPVYFTDAFGRETCFDLRWVSSLEFLEDWLRRTFKDTGLRKVHRGEFLIRELKSGQDLDLSKNWKSLFTPGMHVAMSMIYRVSMINVCPQCQHIYLSPFSFEATCPHCSFHQECIDLNKVFDRGLSILLDVKNPQLDLRDYNEVHMEKIKQEWKSIRRIQLVSNIDTHGSVYASEIKFRNTGNPARKYHWFGSVRNDFDEI